MHLWTVIYKRSVLKATSYCVFYWGQLVSSYVAQILHYSSHTNIVPISNTYLYQIHDNMYLLLLTYKFTFLKLQKKKNKINDTQGERTETHKTSKKIRTQRTTKDQDSSLEGSKLQVLLSRGSWKHIEAASIVNGTLL